MCCIPVDFCNRRTIDRNIRNNVLIRTTRHGCSFSGRSTRGRARVRVWDWIERAGRHGRAAGIRFAPRLQQVRAGTAISQVPVPRPSSACKGSAWRCSRRGFCSRIAPRAGQHAAVSPCARPVCRVRGAPAPGADNSLDSVARRVAVSPPYGADLAASPWASEWRENRTHARRGATGSYRGLACVRLPLTVLLRR